MGIGFEGRHRIIEIEDNNTRFLFIIFEFSFYIRFKLDKQKLETSSML